MAYKFEMDIKGCTDKYWLEKSNKKVREMGLKGKMKKLYKLGCILKRRKPGDKHLSCEQHKPFKKNHYDWCDNCIYNMKEEL